MDKTENYSDKFDVNIEEIFNTRKYEDIVCSNILDKEGKQNSETKPISS